jgi:hypothetical protein
MFGSLGLRVVMLGGDETISRWSLVCSVQHQCDTSLFRPSLTFFKIFYSTPHASLVYLQIYFQIT